MEEKKSYCNPNHIKIRHLPLKRLFDIGFSLIFCICFSPFFLGIALAILLSSKGTIFYAHLRIGRGGKCFKCYKFRTMYSDADQQLKHLLTENTQLKKEWDAHYKLKQDPRVTPVGRFLRKTSLDELPQFWNILKGNLSIVGPRPLVRTEIQRFFGKKAEKILSIRPGLTCFWQVSGRSNLSYQKRIELDEYYIEKRTLFTDLLLICKTVKQIFQPKGAY